MILTYQDFIDWKSQLITKAVFAEMDKKIQGIAGELATSAGLDPLFDRYRAGIIQGVVDIMNMEAADVVEKDND